MKNKKTARALVAHHVRRLRQEAGLSQELLAAKCGFHRTYISQVEREQANITLDNLQRIAEVLEVGTAELLEVI
jgi:transcriptional regulator with XRE-family HTH domain